MINLIRLARHFEKMTKLSYVRKVPGGWGVFSHKGKPLGTYKTKEEANKRLQQIHFFKHKKASDDTYTSIVRSLKDDQETVNHFKKVFKESFDHALITGEEKPEDMALEQAMKAIEDAI